MSNQKTYANLNSILLIFIGIAFLVLSFFTEEPESELETLSSKVNPISKKPIDLINEHLERSYDKQIINQINVRNENSVLAPRLQDSQEEIPLTEEEIRSLFGGRNFEEMIASEIKKQEDLQGQIEIQELERNDQMINDEKQRLFREKHAALFIEKARKDGFDIELDDEFRVKSVKKNSLYKKQSKK